jgi:hypothetical protein
VVLAKKEGPPALSFEALLNKKNQQNWQKNRSKLAKIATKKKVAKRA